MHAKEFLQTKGKFTKLLGIDYGKKYVGFASCDPLHISVYSVNIIANNNELLHNFIVDFCSKESVSCIVLGFPFNDSTDNSPFQDEILAFNKGLETLISVPIYLQDESFSTVEAGEIMRIQGKKKKQRSEKGKKDAIAACVILRRFFEENQ